MFKMWIIFFWHCTEVHAIFVTNTNTTVERANYMSNPIYKIRGVDFDSTSRRHSKKKILVVDDDGTILRALRRTLMKNYQVETASNAEVAAVKLSRSDYYAIITDFDMPMYNGIWLLGQVAVNYPTNEQGDDIS